MSADYNSSMLMDGNTHRLMQLIGDIARMDENYNDCTHQNVNGIRVLDCRQLESNNYGVPLAKGNERLLVCYQGYGLAYRFSLDVARMVLEKYPDVAKTMHASYGNDQYDGFGGYSYYDDEFQWWSWSVEPDDWTAFLAEDWRNTSQYMRWVENVLPQIREKNTGIPEGGISVKGLYGLIDGFLSQDWPRRDQFPKTFIACDGNVDITVVDTSCCYTSRVLVYMDWNRNSPYGKAEKPLSCTINRQFERTSEGYIGLDEFTSWMMECKKKITADIEGGF